MKDYNGVWSSVWQGPLIAYEIIYSPLFLTNRTVYSLVKRLHFPDFLTTRGGQ